MQNFKKVLASVLMFSFIVFNTSPLIVLATEEIDQPVEPAIEETQPVIDVVENVTENEINIQTQPVMVNICHKTGSEQNPWNALTINENAISAHDEDHEDYLYFGEEPFNDEWCANNAPQASQTASVTVFKYTTGGDSTFHFTGLGLEGGFDLTTVEGENSTSFVVDTGEDGESYSVTEQATEGWNLTNAYCFKGSHCSG